jgi:hypothetical protein
MKEPCIKTNETATTDTKEKTGSYACVVNMAGSGKGESL